MKKGHRIILYLFAGIVCLCSCSDGKSQFIDDNVDFASQQTKLMIDELGEPDMKNYPRTIDDEGKLRITHIYDWTSGFFPGSLWYLYELTGDTLWRNNAEVWTASLESLKTFKGHHDLGFMMFCSYGNAYRLTGKPEYKDIIIKSAESLASRFSEKTQAIKSWDYAKAWNDTTEWFYPVIADNMMNLELLFAGSELSGDKRLYDIAVAHANTTLKDHLRDDFSSYHVVDYDAETGAVKDKATHQGYSDNSTWSRGQAWIIYGFTLMYRETNDPEYLDIAVKATDYYLKNLPGDLIPVWDFNAGQEGYNPEGKSYAVTYKEKKRDASAGAIVCSALFELGELSGNAGYIDKATKMLQALASPAYRAESGKNGNFILMHSVGSIPHNSEIDKPLVYADYYFLEALTRYKKLN